MTVKYYWYITIKPDSSALYMGDIDPITKRSTTAPPDDIFYISETISDYKHIIKEKNNPDAITINDYGKPQEIERINNQLKNRIQSKWLAKRREYNDKKERESNKTSSTSIGKLERSLASDFTEEESAGYLSNPFMMPGMFEAMARKRLKRRKVNVNRKGTCKCMKTVRRTKTVRRVKK